MKSKVPADPREALYKATIMSHYRSTEFRRILPDPTMESQQVNRSCGDKVKLQFHVDNHGTILDAAYQGEGCSVCIASASILCGMLRGKTLKGASEASQTLIAMLETKDVDQARIHYDRIFSNHGEDAPVLALWSVREFGARIPCALLSWKIIPSLLEKAVS